MTDLPIICTLEGAAARDERAAEFADLFARALSRCERTPHGARLHLRAEPEVETNVRDLAQREAACCPFFTFAVEPNAGELWWDASVPDNEAARAILDLLDGLAER